MSAAQGQVAWIRSCRRGKARRFTEPVTLVAALEKEDAGARAGMVEQHRACLSEMIGAADGVISATPRDDPGRPGVGLAPKDERTRRFLRRIVEAGRL